MVREAPNAQLRIVDIAQAAGALGGVAAAAAPFGIGFGAAAVEMGMSAPQAVAMSALVFSGGAQFAALDAMNAGSSWGALAAIAFVVSARHVAMGALLADAFRALRPVQRPAVAFFLSDANFAAARLAAGSGGVDLSKVLGGGLALWAAWVIGTVIGATLGDRLGDLSRFGVDVVMIAFFAAAATGEARRRNGLRPVVVAAASACAAFWVAPASWAVIVGGLFGGLAAATLAPREDMA